MRPRMMMLKRRLMVNPKRRVAEVEMVEVVGDVEKKEEGKDGRGGLMRTPRRRLRRRMSDAEKVVVEEEEEEEEEDDDESACFRFKLSLLSALLVLPDGD